MPWFDVTFDVSYRKTTRVSAVDSDYAAEMVGDSIHEMDVPVLAKRVSVELYDCAPVPKGTE